MIKSALTANASLTLTEKRGIVRWQSDKSNITLILIAALAA